MARRTAFRTVALDHRLLGSLTPHNLSTVGTGMIVPLEFGHPVRHRAVVQRAVRVTARPAVPVAPHWFGRSRLDFRPEHYWKPGPSLLPVPTADGAPRTPSCHSRATAPRTPLC